jgi:ATP-binding cassette subfamily C protein
MNSFLPQNSHLRQCIGLFSKHDRNKIVLVIVIQIFLGFLDLFGVALVGVLGALAVTGIQSQQPGNRVSEVLNLLQLGSFSFQTQAALLAFTAAGFFITRTIFSIYISRRILLFVSRRSAAISSDLVARVLNQDLSQINSKSIHETIYSTTAGVTAATTGTVGILVNIIADSSILLIMSIGLFALDPLVASAAGFLFCIVGLILYRTMHLRARNYGNAEAALNVNSNTKIAEVLLSYRENLVRNRRSFYLETITKARFDLSQIIAELNFLPMISKYVIEVSLVIGAILIAGIQFQLEDARHAVATLAVFMAAGSRIAPAVLRIQQGAVAMKANLGASENTLQMISSLPRVGSNEVIPEYKAEHINFSPSIGINGLSFIYPDAVYPVVQDITIDIKAGSKTAIVGPSGSGKTTLVDLMLGMYKPNSGEVLIAGMSPGRAVKEFPGAIGYVPQDVVMIDGTLRENISMGFPENEATDDRIWSAIRMAMLEEFVVSLPEGIDTQIGTRGTKLSGGQRQRVGIARAFFTKPKILFLDESTSALDSQTEKLLSNALEQINYELTLILIAHRLSTIQNADQIIYLEKGRIAAKGNFEELRAAVPNFAVQADLMGL